MAEAIKLGLLGNGIGRSRSQKLHELIGELYGLDVSYRLMDLEGRGDVDIRQELIRCRDQGFNGVNVTHPYKRDAFKCVEPLPGFPPGLTSVNTVLLQSDQLLGDNTDYSGFSRAYNHCFGYDSKPGRVLMLGAGGVGLAIAFALHRLGAAELVVYDKNSESAQALIETANRAGLSARLSDADLAGEMRAANGLINATPIGMFQYPGNPFPAAGFGRQDWAFDAVYTPENTEFLEQCRTREITTISGFKLFLYQGLDAFNRFTQLDVDDVEVEKYFLKRYPLESSVPQSA